VFCFYVYLELYRRRSEEKFAANVGDVRGKYFVTAFNQEILEQCIIWCAFIFKSIAVNEFTNIISLTTLPNEAFNGKLRHFAYGRNDPIKAEHLVLKFYHLDRIRQSFGLMELLQRRVDYYSHNIEERILI